MKSKPKILTLIALVASCAFLQGSMAQPPPDEHHGPGPGHGDHLAMLTKELGLTAEQQTAIKPILEKAEQAMKAAHDAAETEINGLLTDEQKAKLAKFKAEHPHGPGGPGHEGHGPGQD